MKVTSRKSWNPRRLDVRAFSEAEGILEGQQTLALFERLNQERHAGVPVDALVDWTVRGELRPDGSVGRSPWLHLKASLDLPVTCQRCLDSMTVPLEVDRWFRFVADEALAAAQDDESEEDVLALEPKPDLLSLIEDELLMVIPMVPMHEVCPLATGLGQTAAESMAPLGEDKPHPFEALARLKK
ncbi:MAG: DUF177 domain-containing protein [Hydrogenophaga sp.]|nr:DUF177 domain-containing protein [Hydrogenophaga sp.]